MRPPNLRLDHVYEVVTAIPAIGARPGDEILVRASNAEFPLTVIRQLGLDVLPAIPDAAVMFVASYEPESDVPVGEETTATPRPALRLVR